MTKRALIADLVISAALMLVAAAFGIYLYGLGQGLLPNQDVFFGADTRRVASNLIDLQSDFRRANVHPLFGAVCIVFQTARHFSSTLLAAFRNLAAFNGMAFAAVMYFTMRLWGVTRLVSVAGVVLAASLGAFTYWVAVPETHFLGGLTALMSVNMARWRPRDQVAAILYSAAGFALSFSLVVTNIVIWGIAFLTRTNSERISEIVRKGFQRAPEAIANVLAGLGLSAIAFAGLELLMKNHLIGGFFHFGQELQYMGGQTSRFGGLAALGILAPTTPTTFLVDAVAGLAMLVALFRLRGPPIAFAAFALFGVVLHTVYDRSEAFLFSPNYAPAAAVAFILAFGAWRPRLMTLAVGAIAIALGIVNVRNFETQLHSIKDQSTPIANYDQRSVRLYAQ
jgi:hypothetical protein